MISHPLLERVKEYFLAKGLKPVKPEGTAEPDDELSLAFQGEAEKDYVKVLSKEQLTDRNIMLDAILKSASYTQTANKVYLVLPKIYASLIDGKIFQRYGVGLVTYDEKGIGEVVPPRFFNHEPPAQPAIPKGFAEEFERLKNRVYALEQTVKSLTVELTQLKAIKPQAMEVEVKTRKMDEPTPVSEGLPSFLRDNPWLDILSKRGKEPERYVS
jgi:hypothetical protein